MYKRQVLLITNCFTVIIKGVISDLIGVLYLFCFHCTYDDRIDWRNNMNVVNIFFFNTLILKQQNIWQKNLQKDM